MRDLLLLPIEPLTERYSEQWYRRLPLEFRAAGFNVKVIDGVPLLDNEIKVGAFLDINSTIHYKMTQLQALAAMFNSGQVKDGTVIWFSDIEFWGLECVRLMADMNRVSVKLAGFLHAASFTVGDAFAIAAPYQRYTEAGWAKALDLIFVGSEYSKNRFASERLHPLGIDSRHVVATGNPFFAREYPAFKVPKENLVLLSNRFDAEKRPDETMALFELAKQRHPDWRFVICTGRPELRSNDPNLVTLARELESTGVVEIADGLTKNQYHELLAKAQVMVSHSREESYGYCIAEALCYSCMPFVTNCASHPEMVSQDSACLFPVGSSVEQQLRLLETAMSPEVQGQFRSTVNHKVENLEKGLPRILSHLVAL